MNSVKVLMDMQYVSFVPWLSNVKQDMLVHVPREYGINKMFLSYLGLWPFQAKVILMLYDNVVRNNPRMVFESCYQIVLLTTFVVKLWNEYWNYDKIRILYETVEKHWNIFTSEFEIRTLKDYTAISRKFTIVYSLLMFSMVAIFLIIPLTPILLDIIWPLNEPRPRFFAVSIEWRIDKDKYFVPIFCYNMSIIVTGSIIMVSVDTKHVTCTVHACSIFSIIGQQFKKITSKLEIYKHVCCLNEDFELLNEQVIYQEYITCLKKYQLALKFVDILNSMYQTIALILLLLTGATVSLVGIRIVYVLDQLEEVMRFGFIIIGMLIQLLIICYAGQKLIDESQNVFHQAYAAEWYKFSPRLKSLLIITLRRSYAPCNLMAGNMFPLSMATYFAVVRTGISYFMTFLSFKD